MTGHRIRVSSRKNSTVEKSYSKKQSARKSGVGCRFVKRKGIQLRESDKRLVLKRRRYGAFVCCVAYLLTY